MIVENEHESLLNQLLESECTLSREVSFVLVGFDRMLLRYSATVRFFLEKSLLRSFSFCRPGGDGIADVLDAREVCRGSSEENVPTSEDVSRDFIELTVIDGVDMSETSKSSTCFGLSSFAGEFDCASTMVAGGK